MSAELTIEDVLNYEGLDYKDTTGTNGAQWNIQECQNPECDSDNYKVYCNAEISVGNCFKCGKNFNLFTFARWILQRRNSPSSNKDVGAYLEALRRHFGFRPERKKVEIAVATNDGVVKLPFNLPVANLPANVPYLDRRGISQEWAAKYDLRFCNFGVNVYRNPQGEEIKQDFSKRIIIPVHDLNGNLVTFQGRDITGQSDQKYKFAGGLPGTARYLYRGHVALALKAKHVLLCEGAVDVIKAQMALSQYADTAGVVVLGSWGKHLSKASEGDDQRDALQTLKRAGLETVTVMYDGEELAYEEALKACEMIVAVGLKARLSILPAGLDPGEADARVVREKYLQATEISRLSLLKLRFINPYKQH